MKYSQEILFFEKHSVLLHASKGLRKIFHRGHHGKGLIEEIVIGLKKKETF